MALAQSTASGIVVSSSDEEPVIGASIRVKGTATCTVTDATGTAQKYIYTPFDYDVDAPIVVYCNQAPFTYDPAEKTFEFPFYWYVPALGGGWGIYSCYLVLD